MSDFLFTKYSDDAATNTAAYKEERWDLISGVEGVVPTVYYDKRGQIYFS